MKLLNVASSIAKKKKKTVWQQCRYPICAREKQKQVKQEEDEPKGRTDITRQRHKNHKWDPNSGHQTWIQIVDDPCLV